MIKQWLVSHKHYLHLAVCIVLLSTAIILNVNANYGLHKNTTASVSQTDEGSSSDFIEPMKQEGKQLGEQKAQLEQQVEDNDKIIENSENQTSINNSSDTVAETQSVVAVTSTETVVSASISVEPAVVDLPADEYPEAKLIWDTIKSWGWSDNAAAGILGNMMTEVGGNTLKGLSNWAADGCGYGLIQWTSGRKATLKSLYGSQPNIVQQLEYMKNELLGANGIRQQVTQSQLDSILNADSPEDAAYNFASYYERCASSHRAKRRALARIAYTYFAR